MFTELVYKKKFGNSNLEVIKLHVEYDMMNGLDIECKLFYDKNKSKIELIMKTFQEMLKTCI